MGNSPARNDYVEVCTFNDLKANGRMPGVLNGTAIAVFLVDGNVYATEDKCAHGRGSLIMGDIEELSDCHGGTRLDGSREGGLCVRCPKHRKKFAGGLHFNLAEGRSFVKGPSIHYTEGFQVSVYNTRVDKANDSVLVCPTPREQQGRQTKPALLLHKAMKNIASFLSTTDDDGWQLWKLEEVNLIASNCAIFRFSSDHVPTFEFEDVGAMWHISTRAVLNIDGEDEEVARDYTPISIEEDYLRGEITLLVKRYPKGKMSGHFFALSPGDMLEMSIPQPTVDIDAAAGGTICMLVGGTGVAPAFQLARVAVEIPQLLGHAAVSILFSSQTEESLYLRRDLDRFEDASENVTITYTVTKSSRTLDFDIESVSEYMGSSVSTLASTPGGSSSTPLSFPHRRTTLESSLDGSDVSQRLHFRRIDADMIAECFPPPHEVAMVIVCGPEGMWETLSKELVILGYDQESLVELEA